MPNELAKKGAQSSRPTRYAAMWSNRFATGVWTQRSPYRDAASTRIEEEYYGARGDALIDGLNTEVSAKLTFIRRPGSSVYNSVPFPAINRFYENRTSTFNAAQTVSTENIQVIADTGFAVYDATGPATQVNLFTKTTGAGKTSFQSVGNSLYFSDGPDQKKLLTPSLVWAPNTVYQTGQYILDPAGNIQAAESEFTLNITTVEVNQLNSVWYVLITFSDPIPWSPATPITFAGMTGYTSLNGLTLSILDPTVWGSSPSQIAVYAPTATPYGPAGDTGTATSQNGVTQGQSGGTEPAWNETLGGTTSDGNIQWRNFGLPVYDWATKAPITAPTLSPNPANRQWTPNTTLFEWYSILDNNKNVQVVVNFVPGIGYITGGNIPVWNTIPPTLSSSGGQTTDYGIIWQNCGPILSWAPLSPYQTFQCVLDTNQNLQIVTNGGGGGSATGGSNPVWNTVVGGHTTDGTITWTCVGSGNVVITGNVQYAYSYHSIDGSVTTASPVVNQTFGTQVLGPARGYLAKLFGPSPSDPQIDQIWIWRTVQGGSQLFFLDAIPNPIVGTASTWTYTDFLPDTSLDNEIEAPIMDANDPPPVGINALTYHLGRVWGAVGTSVYFSEGPDVTAGNGNTAWSPSDVFVFPSTVVRLFPTVNGLFVFTVSDVYIISGTSTTTFFSAPFYPYLGLVSYDAFAVNGSTIYMYTSDNQLVSMDLNSGLSEIGFPIGDQFGPGNGNFTPSSAFVTWHISGSADKGLYVSDGVENWWRLSPTPAPETGNTWSPKASILGGFSAVQSVEISPGTRNLLIGPESGGPILKRDDTVFTDNGAAYDAFLTLGSVVLAQPGQLASVVFFTTDSPAVGTPLTLAVQLDEIGTTIPGFFEALTAYQPDPTQLEPSHTLYSQRFYISQTQQPAVCRSIQIKVLWGQDTVQNELYTMTLYGGFESEL